MKIALSFQCEIQEFTSSSGTGESSGDSSPDSFATSEEYCPRGEDENSLELFTSTQGTNTTTTTFETTPKSALNQAEMVEIPRRVPTRPKNFAPRSRRGPRTGPDSQGGFGSVASSQGGQGTTQEDGQRVPSPMGLGDSSTDPGGAGPLEGGFGSSQQPGVGAPEGLLGPPDTTVRTLRFRRDVVTSTPPKRSKSKKGKRKRREPQK